jgi:hypothetical protein
MAAVHNKMSCRADSSTTRGTGHDGDGIFSFIHLDAAAATVLALEHEGPAVYAIVHDEPAPVREWLPVLASALSAKPARQVLVWLARMIAGEGAVMPGTEARGASNAEARKELGWTLRYPSWRQGFTAACRQPKPLTACTPTTEWLSSPRRARAHRAALSVPDARTVSGRVGEMTTETVMTYFDDLDAMGVVHNGRYVILFERALGAYWTRAGWPYDPGQPRFAEVFFVVRENTITYHVPISRAGAV